MKAEEYLLQVRMLNKKIQNKIIECEQLRSMAEGTSVAITGDRVQSSGSQDKMGKTVCKMVDMQDELNAEIDKFVELKNQVIQTIQKVDDPDVYDVLHMYYVQELNWTIISKEKNFTYQWIHELKKRGITQVQEILDNTL